MTEARPGFADHFSGHAADYAAYRPSYPPQLFADVSGVCASHERAWDCGTGSGQAAVSLAKHFDQVVATDASPQQVAQSRVHPRVRYVVARAEAAGLADQSVDPVLIAQALHWFDLERFYAEVRRVVRKGGVIAAWAYDLHHVDGLADDVLGRFFAEVDSYWPPQRAYVKAGYGNLPFPFAPIAASRLDLRQQWSLAQMLGYLGTWSAVKRYERARGIDPVQTMRTELARAWGGAERIHEVHWQLPLRIGRVG